MTSPVQVGIVLGSDSDLDTMLETVKVLDALGVGSEVVVASAHRTPRRTEEWASGAAGRGLRVLIAAAGGAAALPGGVAAFSPLPVIGVPIPSTSLNGLDSLLSIVQMPKGVPVATVAIGAWGAANAGVLAAQMLALGDPALAERLAVYRRRLAEEVEQRAQRVADRMRARPGAGGTPRAASPWTPAPRRPPRSTWRPRPCAPGASWRFRPRRSTGSAPRPCSRPPCAASSP